MSSHQPSTDGLIIDDISPDSAIESHVDESTTTTVSHGESTNGAADSPNDATKPDVVIANHGDIDELSKSMADHDMPWPDDQTNELPVGNVQHPILPPVASISSNDIGDTNKIILTDVTNDVAVTDNNNNNNKSNSDMFTAGCFLCVSVDTISYTKNSKKKEHRGDITALSEDEAFFIPDQLEPYSEHDYWGHLFITHDWAKPVTSGETTFGIVKINSKTQKTAVFEFAKSLRGHHRSWPMPPSLMLCFNGYCYQATDTQQMCINTKGSANAWVRDLAKTTSGSAQLPITESHLNNLALGYIEIRWEWKSRVISESEYKHLNENSDDESLLTTSSILTPARLSDSYVLLKQEALPKSGQTLYMKASDAKNTFPALSAAASEAAAAAADDDSENSDDLSGLVKKFDDAFTAVVTTTGDELLKSGKFPRYITPETMSAAESVFQRIREESLSIYKFGEFKGALKPSVHYVGDIHCPYYKTDTGSNLPGSAYAFGRVIIPTRAKVLWHLLEKALEVQNVSVDTLINTIKRFTTPSKEDAAAITSDMLSCCVVLSEFLTLPVTAEPYSSDVVVRPGSADPIDVENYQVPRTCGAQDCEGFAAESNVLYKELLALEDIVDKSSSSSSSSQLTRQQQDALLATRELALRYAPFLCLASVTSASFSNKEKITDDQVFAHTFFVLFPRKAVMDRALKYETNSWKAVSNLPAPSPPMSKWEDTLPLLLCEGTGRVHPIQQPLNEIQVVDKATFYQEQTVRLAKIAMAHKVLENTSFEMDENVKTTFYQQQQQQSSKGKLSDFYLYIVSAYTCWDPLIELGVSDVTFGYPANGTYGVSFEDFVMLRSNFKLYLDASIEKHEYLLIADALAQCEPIPPYRISFSANLSEARRKRKDLISSTLDSFLTKASDGKKFTIDYYIRLEDIRDNHLTDIKSAITNKQITSFNYSWCELVYPASMPEGVELVMLKLSIAVD